MRYFISQLVVISIFSSLSGQTDTARLNSPGKDRFEKAKKRLNLTPDQEAKMKEIHQNRKIEIERRKEENRLFRDNMRKKTEVEIDQILTPEQQLEFDKMKAERKEKIKENRGRRPHPKSRGKWQGKGGHKSGPPADTTKW